jgi:uncharacterized protein YjbI with pentapeptide repeats
MKGTSFINCLLKECDFSEADLREADFDSSDLSDATFDQTLLEKADFTSAIGFRIQPDQNRIKGAMFSRDNLAGLLMQYEIKIV